MDIQSRSEQLQGIYFASAAFVMWGFVPVYFKLVSQISPFEVLAHRVLWSVVFLILFIIVTQRTREIFQLFKRPRIISGLALSAVVIAINWLIFIWAVGQGKIVETTLGYFINPLINILFGMIFFNERLRAVQWVSIGLATCAVAYQVFLLGELPWIALTLACCFSTYSVLRKQIPVDSVSGLLIETLWLLPISLVYMGWLFSQDQFQILSADTHMVWLLLFAGLVTSLPLLAFASGARRLSLTLIGLLQYIGPSIAFLIAVFYYHEPMNGQRLVPFVLIWIGLAIFSAEGILFQHRKHKQVVL